MLLLSFLLCPVLHISAALDHPLAQQNACASAFASSCCCVCPWLGTRAKFTSEAIWHKVGGLYEKQAVDQGPTGKTTTLTQQHCCWARTAAGVHAAACAVCL